MNATATDGVDGVALGLSTLEWVAEESYDWRDNPKGDLLQNFTYTKNDDHPMPYADLTEDGQRLRLRLPEKGGTAPNVTQRDILGVTDLYEGRLVQEGYSDGGTTYSRQKGNFVPVGFARGTAPTVPVNQFDELVHVITDDY